MSQMLVERELTSEGPRRIGEEGKDKRTVAVNPALSPDLATCPRPGQ
jgi:hypothetical protein